MNIQTKGEDSEDSHVKRVGILVMNFEWNLKGSQFEYGTALVDPLGYSPTEY